MNDKEEPKHAMIAYVVIAGMFSNSGNGILAVFSTREAADNYVASYNENLDKEHAQTGYPHHHHDDAGVEEWEMDKRE
jgi:hypothetical protein